MESAGSSKVTRERFKQALALAFLTSVVSICAGAVVGLVIAGRGDLTRLTRFFTAYYFGMGYGIAGFIAGAVWGLTGRNIPRIDKISVRWTFAPALIAGTAAFYTGLQRIYRLYSRSGLIDKTDVTEMIVLLAGVALIVCIVSVAGLELVVYLFKSKRLFPACVILALTPFVFLAPIVKSSIDFKTERFDSNNLAGSYPGGRILLLGLDGADWNLLDPLVASGELPGFAELIESSVTAPLISMYMFSPQSWTSIGTGCYRDKHGVYDFQVIEYPDGERRAAQEVPLGEYVVKAYDRVIQASMVALERTRKNRGVELLGLVPDFFHKLVIRPVLETAFPIENRTGGRLSATSFNDVGAPFLWECFQAAGAACGVVNWLNSTPADPEHGWIISGAAGVERVPTYSRPESKFYEINEYWRKHRTVWLGPELTPCADSLLAWRIEDAVDAQDASLALDEAAVRSFGEAEAARVVIPQILRRHQDMEFLAWPLYFTDALGHRFCHLLERPEEGRRYSGIYLESLKRVDKLIQALLDIEDLTICIVSDHGMSEVPAEENLQLDWQGFKFDFSRLITLLSADASSKLPVIIPKVTSDGTYVFDLDTADEKAVSWWFNALKSVTIEFDRRESALFQHLRCGRKDEPAILVEEFASFKFNELRDLDSWEIRSPSGSFGASELITDLGIRCLHGRPSPDSRRKLGREGIFILHGSNVEKGIRIDAIRTVDVAPTLLYLAGLPISDGMDGLPQFACFESDFLEGRKTFKTSYPRIGVLAHGTNLEETEQVSEALRALGYIQ